MTWSLVAHVGKIVRPNERYSIIFKFNEFFVNNINDNPQIERGAVGLC